MGSLSRVSFAVLSLSASACIPYSVGSTGQTVPLGQQTYAQTMFSVPAGLKVHDDTTQFAAGPMMNIEFRRGLDDFNDFGLRIVPGGLVGNIKHRFGSDTSHASSALALMSGVGFVNAGYDFHFEETLIASAPVRSMFSPYGGIRAMYELQAYFGAAPDQNTARAVSRSPTIGLFGGVTISDFVLNIRPELGVFYGQPDIHAHGEKFILVPSFTITQRSRDPGDYGRGVSY